MTVITPSCSTCRRFHVENRVTETCDAFPQGIPQQILSGANRHKAPVVGDNGLQYVAVPGFEEAEADA